MCNYCIISILCIFFFFFFNDTATTEIYTLSLHDALPISYGIGKRMSLPFTRALITAALENQLDNVKYHDHERSEEHTSELQSRLHLVCRLLLEKKKNKSNIYIHLTILLH